MMNVKQLSAVVMAIGLMSSAMPGTSAFFSEIPVISASAEDAEQGTYEQLTYTKYSDRIEITNCDKSIAGDLVIPAEIDGLPVRAIGVNAFSYCQNLLTVEIPENVQSIKELAFVSCPALQSVKFPSSLREIKTAAFEGCSNLTELNLPEGLVIIEERAFGGCSNVTSVNIPETVEALGNGIFQYCTSLTGVTLPASLKNIGNTMFAGCTNLTGISLPNQLIAIGDSAFMDCTNLAEIQIPPTVSAIGAAAFRKCTALTAIQIPANVRNMGAGVFSDCVNLAEISIYKGNLVSIPQSAFSGCTSLTKFTVPDNVQKIEKNAFYGCSSLSEISFSVNVTIIEEDACIGSGLTSVTIRNQNCSIANQLFPDNVVIHGYQDSTAQAYAEKYGCEFQLLEGAPEEIAKAYRMGDVTGDAKINIMDVIAVNKAIYAKIDLTDDQLRAADVNRTGKPDASDALMIMKYIIRLIDSFV